MSKPVEAAVRALLELARPREVDAVWLFGSRARGEERPDSDVDLAILCDPPLGPDRFAAIEVVGRAAGLGADVVDMAECDPTLAWEVITTGRLVREGRETRVEDFVRRARFRAADDDHRYKVALAARL